MKNLIMGYWPVSVNSHMAPTQSKLTRVIKLNPKAKSAADDKAVQTAAVEAAKKNDKTTAVKKSKKQNVPADDPEPIDVDQDAASVLGIGTKTKGGIEEVVDGEEDDDDDDDDIVNCCRSSQIYVLITSRW